MVHSRTECEFNENYRKVENIIKTVPYHKEDHLRCLKDFYDDRHSYADYSILQIPGLRGFRGSSCAESNHSSILVHLNDGSRGENKYKEHPTTLFKDLLRRNQSHIKKWNKLPPPKICFCILQTRFWDLRWPYLFVDLSKTFCCP